MKTFRVNEKKLTETTSVRSWKNWKIFFFLHFLKRIHFVVQMHNFFWRLCPTQVKKRFQRSSWNLNPLLECGKNFWGLRSTSKIQVARKPSETSRWLVTLRQPRLFRIGLSYKAEIWKFLETTAAWTDLSVEIDFSHGHFLRSLLNIWDSSTNPDASSIFPFFYPFGEKIFQREAIFQRKVRRFSKGKLFFRRKKRFAQEPQNVQKNKERMQC